MHYIDSPFVFVFAIIFPIWTPAEQKQKPFNEEVSKAAGKISRGRDKSLDRTTNANTVTSCAVFPQHNGHTVKRWKLREKKTLLS